MKIEKISVNGLFGVFNHEIPLSQNSDVTIVIGENGIGKTKILEAINALFGGNYQFFCLLQFDKFLIYFDNKEWWELSRKSADEIATIYIIRGHLGKESNKNKLEKLYVNNTHKNMHRRQLKEMSVWQSSLEENHVSSREMYDGLYNKEMLAWAYLSQKSTEEVKPPKWFTASHYTQVPRH